MLGWTENSLKVKLSVFFFISAVEKETVSALMPLNISGGLLCIVLTEDLSLFTLEIG